MKISGFESIVSLNSFEHQIKVNCHEFCCFRVSVAEKELKTLMGTVGSECNIEDDAFKFSGIITEVSSVYDVSGIELTVLVEGKTRKFDIEAKYRVFQDEKKQFSGILKKLNMPEIKYKGANQLEIKPVIVQDNETDWTFVKRLASAYGKYVFPGEKPWVGEPADSGLSIADEDIITMRNSMNIKQSSIECLLKKKLEFGKRVSFAGKKYWVDSIIYKMEREEFFYTYHLIEEQNDNAEYVEHKPYYLIATVKDNNDPDKKGRVKVEFKEPYEDAMKDASIWIDCNSLYASKDTGIVAIPSVDDTVLVNIYNGVCRVESVSRTDAYNEKYTDCNTKYLIFDKDTYMSFNGENFIFDNSKLKLEISKEKANLSFGDKLRFQISDNLLKLETDKTQMEFASEVKISTKGLCFDGGSKIETSASSVVIKGKSGVSIN